MYNKIHISRRRNILETQNSEYLRSCRYNSSDPDDRLCPIFQLETITGGANESYEEMAVLVGSLSIQCSLAQFVNGFLFCWCTANLFIK